MEPGLLKMSSVYNKLNGRKQLSSLTGCSRRRGGAKKWSCERPPLPTTTHRPVFINTIISNLCFCSSLQRRCCHWFCKISACNLSADKELKHPVGNIATQLKKSLHGIIMGKRRNTNSSDRLPTLQVPQGVSAIPHEINPRQ